MAVREIVDKPSVGTTMHPPGDFEDIFGEKHWRNNLPVFSFLHYVFSGRSGADFVSRPVVGACKFLGHLTYAGATVAIMTYGMSAARQEEEIFETPQSIRVEQAYQH